MTFNLALAAIPVLLALALFRSPRVKGATWWVGIAVFLAFLPNAPYVLTDIAHLRGDIPQATSSVHAISIFWPYAALLSLALVLYGTSIALVRRSIPLAGCAPWRCPVDVRRGAPCPVAIFLGRFARRNRSELAARPSGVLQSVRVPRPSTV